MYIDGLLQRLCEAKKVGCWIGNVYVGALADADDVTLLAPGHRAMRLQLQICEEYGREFRIVFNAERSVWLRVSKKPSHSDDSLQFWIDGTVIKLVLEYLHLGQIISSRLDDNSEILAKRTPPLPFGRICFVVLVMGKGGESS